MRLGDMLEIDGSYLEGGGQIVRTAVALSAIRKTPIKIYNIRKGRSEQGLKAQHLTGIRAAAALCNAKVKGGELGSTELTFVPGKIRFGKFRFDVGTAGAITLVLQTIVPIAAFAPSKVKFDFSGGTNVAWSPPIEYFQNVFCDYAEKFGLFVNSKVESYGFYPKGGGLVKVEVFPIKEGSPLYLTKRGRFFNIKAYSVASKGLKGVAERQLESFTKVMPEGYSVRGFANYVESRSPGSSLYAHALYENCKLGSSALGERGKRAEEVGEECAKNLLEEIASGATADKYLADQIIPFLGLFGGEFVTSAVTRHTKTNIWVTEKFIEKKFKIKKNKISISP